jgi:hypothetical protein
MSSASGLSAAAKMALILKIAAVMANSRTRNSGLL